MRAQRHSYTTITGGVGATVQVVNLITAGVAAFRPHQNTADATGIAIPDAERLGRGAGRRERTKETVQDLTSETAVTQRRQAEEKARETYNTDTR